MTRSSKWLRPRLAAPKWSQLLRLGAAFAILSAGCLVASEHTAQGGINVWTGGNGGPHGFTYTLAIDPQTSTTLYAGAADGVYKTTDGGDTWTVNALVPTDLSEVFALAIDPQTPTTLYAGIGSTYHGGQLRAQLVAEGVYKTTDGGNTWSTTGLSSPVGALAIDPQTPTTLYAGAGRFGSVEGVYKTTDGGNTWSITGLSSPVGALAIDPQTPATLYAGTGGPGSAEGLQGVYKTTDGGDTWITLSLPAGEWSRVVGLAIDPQNPTTLYAGTERCYETMGGGQYCVPDEAYKSTDGGDTWDRLPVATSILAIDPQTSTTLYAAADGVFKSTDGGSTWTDFSTGLPRGESVFALAIDPVNPLRVYAATGVGVFTIDQMVVGTGTPASCTEAALTAALRGLVTFDCGPDPVTITITSTKTIAYDTVIDGGGRITISGGNRVGVFAVQGLSLTVQNLTIADAESSSAGVGGGIFNVGGNVSAANSTFSGNRAAVYGGGIYSYGGTVTVTNSTFSGNSAGYGGGGVFSDTGTVTVTNSTFSDNSASNGSGAGIDSNGGTVTVTNSVFSGNSANHGGGIDSNGGRVTVTDSAFSGNSAHDGGGIASDSELAVTNSTFSGNSAGFSGGAIDSNGGTVTVINSTFSTNTAGAGAGIYSDTSMATVANSTFSDNRAAPYNPGGGIFNVSGVLTVTNSTFSGNSAGSGGGIDNRGTLVVTNSTFSGNSAPDHGGGINSSGTVSSLTVSDSTFSGNSGNYGGGGLDSSGGRVTVNACSFSGNSAVYNGGGIENGSTLTVTNSTFSGNEVFGMTADSAGGAISNRGELTVTNSVFSGNSANAYEVGGGSGGAIDNSGLLTVSNSTFSGNSTAGSGGAIDTANGTLTVTNSTFSGNSAGGLGGGAIANNGGTLTVTNTIVVNSTSGGNCLGSVTDGGHNIDDGTTCGFSTANGSLSNTDPKLDPAGLANNGGPTQTIAFLADSPAINAGDESVCAAAPVNNLDQRGFVRPGTGATRCSIGAYEYNSPGPPTRCVGDCKVDGSVTVHELLTMVNIALGNVGVSECEAGDDNDDGQITIDEILRAVNAALNGCPLTPEA